jgi:hypothetical protein
MTEYIVGFKSSAEEVVSIPYAVNSCQVNPFRSYWRGDAENPEDAKAKAFAAGLKWERD